MSIKKIEASEKFPALIYKFVNGDELKTENDASKTTPMLPQQLNLSANMAWEQRWAETKQRTNSVCEISEGSGALCYVRTFGVRTKNPIGQRKN